MNVDQEGDSKKTIAFATSRSGILQRGQADALIMKRMSPSHRGEETSLNAPLYRLFLSFGCRSMALRSLLLLHIERLRDKTKAALTHFEGLVARKVLDKAGCGLGRWIICQSHP
jgi:hypothetical protein